MQCVKDDEVRGPRTGRVQSDLIWEGHKERATSGQQYALVPLSLSANTLGFNLCPRIPRTGKSVLHRVMASLLEDCAFVITLASAFFLHP